MKNQARVITFDGLDGVGKTTLAKRLTADLKKRNLNSHYVHSPSGEYRRLKATVSRSNSVQERYHFYLACNYNLSERILSADCSEIFVVDRFVFSTFAYHHVDDPRISWNGFGDGLARPMASFLVTVQAPEIQIERIVGRRNPSADNDLGEQDRWSAISAAFRGLPTIEIDNSAPTPDPALAAIHKHLGEIGFPGV